MKPTKAFQIHQPGEQPITVFRRDLPNVVIKGFDEREYDTHIFLSRGGATTTLEFNMTGAEAAQLRDALIAMDLGSGNIDD